MQQKQLLNSNFEVVFLNVYFFLIVIRNFIWQRYAVSQIIYYLTNLKLTKMKRS